jgi:hypothetical protein
MPKQAQQHIVRSRSVAADMAESTFAQMVTPDVSVQERPGHRPADTSGFIAEVKIPQRFQRYIRRIGRIPAPPGGHHLFRHHLLS